MGCDIHLYVEVRKDGQWQNVHTWEEGEDDYYYAIDEDLYDPGRNYRLFAMLADVRNGYGFAGIDTGDRVMPIDDPRGLPEDVSPEIQRKSNDWGNDGFSHSWFTVRELLDYDWTQTVENRGIVDAPTFWKWDRWPRSQGEAPESYAGLVGGGHTEIISEEAMRERIQSVLTSDVPHHRSVEVLEQRLAHVHCQTAWTEEYSQMAAYFLARIMPRLWRLGTPEDVRIVFWFDN